MTTIRVQVCHLYNPTQHTTFQVPSGTCVGDLRSQLFSKQPASNRPTLLTRQGETLTDDQILVATSSKTRNTPWNTMNGLATSSLEPTITVFVADNQQDSKLSTFHHSIAPPMNTNQSQALLLLQIYLEAQRRLALLPSHDTVSQLPPPSTVLIQQQPSTKIPHTANPPSIPQPSIPPPSTSIDTQQQHQQQQQNDVAIPQPTTSTVPPPPSTEAPVPVSQGENLGGGEGKVAGEGERAGERDGEEGRDLHPGEHAGDAAFARALAEEEGGEGQLMLFRPNDPLIFTKKLIIFVILSIILDSRLSQHFLDMEYDELSQTMMAAVGIVMAIGMTEYLARKVAKKVVEAWKKRREARLQLQRNQQQQHQQQSGVDSNTTTTPPPPQTHGDNNPNGTGPIPPNNNNTNNNNTNNNNNPAGAGGGGEVNQPPQPQQRTGPRPVQGVFDLASRFIAGFFMSFFPEWRPHWQHP